MRKMSLIFKDCKLLMRFVVPSMLSMLTAGLYTIVDGLFVSWGAGSDGMAALNVAYPLALLLVACGEMIGIGGAINISIARGRGAFRAAEAVLNTMVRIVIPLGLLLPLAMLPFLDTFLSWMGAAPELLPAAHQYAVIIVGAGVFQMLTMALLEAMRNDDSPHLAMSILVAGLLANILLDYIFVILLRGGVAGSAWATIAAQVLCAVITLRYFTSKRASMRLKLRRWRLRRALLGRMLLAGIPAFGVQISLGVVIWLHNNRALHYGGVAAVSAYAVISYFEAVVLLLIQGIALGLQPVVSFLHGAGKFARRGRMASYAMTAGIAAGVIGMAVSAFGGGLIGRMFNAHGEVLTLAVTGMLITAPMYPLMGFQKISESYFQSMERTGAASLLIYLDSCVVLPVCLFTLPHFFGINGVWAALPVTKTVIFLTALYLWRRKDDSMTEPDDTIASDPALTGRMQKLFDLWGKFDRIYFRLLQQRNLSYNSYLVLEEMLGNPEGVEPAVLADRLNIPRQTMTFVLDHLERDGFLSRLPHPEDRRKKLAKLNPSGLKLARGVADDVWERECRAMEALSGEEQTTLLRIYDKLGAAFEKSFNEPER